MSTASDRTRARDRLRDALAAARARSLRPPPRLHVDQWADQFRHLSPEASSIPGRWDTRRVEVARGVMRAVTEPGVRSISVMACTQLLKTECLNNILGYQLHLSPGPLLVIQPTVSMAEAWSKDRLAPMLRDTPVLRGLVSTKARDADSTTLHKKFAGGHLTMVGANSPAELASRPIRDLYADEVDKYPDSAGEEGDPITIAAEHADTFPSGSLVYHSCSPTIRGKSRIERLYLASDRRVPLAVSNRHAGFWANKLYSPWKPVSSLAEKFLAAKDSPEELKAFINTSLAETFEEQGEQVDAGGLLARREAYPCGDQVPDDVVALFASADAQRNRLEVQTIGLCRDERLRIIDYRIVPGDPADPATLAELAKEIWRPRTRGDGRVFYPEITTIDVGDGAGAAAALYRFCADHRGKRCLPSR